jgi:hypothetical protein
MVKLPAYYVPQCRVRVLSTTSYLQTYAGETLSQDANKMTFSGIPNAPTFVLVIVFYFFPFPPTKSSQLSTFLLGTQR